MTTNTSFSPRKRMYIDRLFQWWFRTQAVIWSWNLSVAITSWYIFTLLYFEHHLHYILRILYTIMYMHIQYSIFYILYSIFYILYFIFYILCSIHYTLCLCVYQSIFCFESCCHHKIYFYTDNDQRFDRRVFKSQTHRL